MRTLIIVAFVLISTAASAGTVPKEIVDIIKSNAAQSHPGDYSTQLYVVKKQKDAYITLAEDAFRGCDAALDEIMQRAAESHPYDYSTQLYVVRKNCAAYVELNKK